MSNPLWRSGWGGGYWLCCGSFDPQHKYEYCKGNPDRIMTATEVLELNARTPYWLCCGSTDYHVHKLKAGPDCMDRERSRWGTAEEHSRRQRDADKTRIDSGSVDEHRGGVHDQLLCECGRPSVVRVHLADGSQELRDRSDLHGDQPRTIVRAPAMVQRPEVRESVGEDMITSGSINGAGGGMGFLVLSGPGGGGGTAASPPDGNGADAGETKPSNPKDVIGSRKIDPGVVPDSAIYCMALALTEGALKYGRYNWRIAGVRASIYHAACRRHLAKWWNGQNADKLTRVHHLDNAMACLALLRDADLYGKLTDDRPPCPNPDAVADLIDCLEAEVKHLRETFKDHSPHQFTINDKEI